MLAYLVRPRASSEGSRKGTASPEETSVACPRRPLLAYFSPTKRRTSGDCRPPPASASPRRGRSARSAESPTSRDAADFSTASPPCRRRDLLRRAGRASRGFFAPVTGLRGRPFPNGQFPAGAGCGVSKGDHFYHGKKSMHQIAQATAYALAPSPLTATPPCSSSPFFPAEPLAKNPFTFLPSLPARHGERQRAWWSRHPRRAPPSPPPPRRRLSARGRLHQPSSYSASRPPAGLS